MEEEDDGVPTAPFWMATFSDMVTLIMCFFVMLVAMSEVEVKKFKEALSYFQGRSGVMMHESVIPPQVPPSPKPGLEHFKRETQDQVHRYEELLEYLEEQNLDEMVQVDLTEKGLHMTVHDSVMFASGRADLIEPSRTILSLVSGVLGQDVGAVVVEGHTDDRPIRTASFPSNWELSTGRAASVVRYLQSLDTALPPDRYVAVGYGEFRPVDTNATREGRARNRRVEILFSWEKWQNETRPQLKAAPATALLARSQKKADSPES